jgi:hypothetical protein
MSNLSEILDKVAQKLSEKYLELDYEDIRVVLYDVELSGVYEVGEPHFVPEPRYTPKPHFVRCPICLLSEDQAKRGSNPESERVNPQCDSSYRK